MNTGLIATVLSVINDYANVKANASPTEADGSEDVAMNDGGPAMINTGGPGGDSAAITYTELTITKLLTLLGEGCKYSNLLIANILQGGLVQVLSSLLPKDNEDLPSYTHELTNLLNVLLPKTVADHQTMKKVIMFGQRQNYPFSDDAQS